jgi:dolichol-phosphate mannosyltransferase
MGSVLVTGAAGFIGANLVRRLLRDGREVHAIVRRSSDLWRLKDARDRLVLHTGDCDDADFVRETLAAALPESVFHAAAHGGYSWQGEADQIIRSNALGTVRLLDACVAADVDRFVHIGSSSEYGIYERPTKEDDLPRPNSLYAVTKLAATNYAMHIAERHGMPVVVARLYSVYGPWEDPARFVPALVSACLAGRLPPLGDPEVSRDFVFVDDCVDALLRAESSTAGTGQVVNVSSGSATTLRELVTLARDVFDVRAEPVWHSHPGRAWDSKTWVGDNSRALDLWSWSTTTDLRSGLEATADWLSREPGVTSSP